MNRPRVKMGVALSSMALAGVVLGFGISARLRMTGEAGAAPVAAAPPPGARSGMSFVDLAKEASPAVVNIQVKIGGRGRGGGGFDPFNFDPGGGERSGEGLGTGFIISPDGYIVTNDHVVGEASEIRVILADEREFEGKVVGSDRKTDIALIKINDRKPFPTVRLGDSDKVEIGEWVVAIGNPLGLDHTVTAGIVSAKGRRNIQPSGHRMLADFIQTDASINPGNSGGPLLNVYGEVIGINSAVNTAGQGIGFAIPINMAKQLVPLLKEHGRAPRSYIGVRFQDVSRDLARSMNLTDASGALIAQVVPDSPADKAGLKPGDVIVGFDGKAVKHSEDLPILAATAGIGKTVNVTVAGPRGANHDVKVTLVEMPEEDATGGGRPRRAVGSNPAPRGTATTALGLEIETLTPELARRLRIEDDTQGVVITDMAGNSPAAGMLTPGDIILSVNDREIGDADAFTKALSSLRAGDVVKLFVVREGMPMWLAFTVS